MGCLLYTSPDWRWMNPKPLLALNHFTVPCSFTSVLTFLLSYLRYSTASSRTTKKAASVNSQPLSSNPKVLQEQQTQVECNMLTYLPRERLNIRRGFALSLRANTAQGTYQFCSMLFTNVAGRVATTSWATLSLDVPRRSELRAVQRSDDRLGGQVHQMHFVCRSFG